MSQTITGIIHGETTGDESGTSIALDDDGSHVVIGAPGNDGNGDDSKDDDDPHTCDDVQGPYHDATACATLEAALVPSRTHADQSQCSWS